MRGRIERGIADLSGVALSDLPQTREEVEEIGRIAGPNAVASSVRMRQRRPSRENRLISFVYCIWQFTVSPTRNTRTMSAFLGTDPKSADDGLLQVREIIRLRLNAELTTLSACDTGVGNCRGKRASVIW